MDRHVVLTKACNLPHSRYILHLSVDNNPTNFKNTLTNALRLGERHNIKTLAFTQLPLNLQHLENILFESIEEFARSDRPQYLQSIQLIASNRAVFNQYASAIQAFEFEKNRDIFFSPTFRSRNSRDRKDTQIKSDKVVAFRESLFPKEIHAEVHGVNLHIETSREDNTYHKSTVAYVMFPEVPWVTRYSPDKRFPDIQPSHITYKTVQDHTLIQIQIDDEPGKFLRLKSTFHKVLRYADQHGIKHVIFPSQFHYGNHQIWFTNNEERKIIIPLLYFQAVCEFALFCHPSQLHIHIYLMQSDSVDVFSRRIFNRSFYLPSYYDYMRVGKTSRFSTHYKFLAIDEVFQACHLSIVGEHVKLERESWARFGKPQRYTYSCAVRRLSPFKVPVEMLLER